MQNRPIRAAARYRSPLLPNKQMHHGFDSKVSPSLHTRSVYPRYIINLTVFVDSARNLPSKDGSVGFRKRSDPYVSVQAHSFSSSRPTLRTSTIGDNNNPTWNEYLRFGEYSWFGFDIHVIDEDSHSGDDLICSHFIDTGPEQRNHSRFLRQQMPCDGGYILVKASFD